MKHSKRAQTELLGFVMVVALVAVALLFVVGFLSRTAQTDVRSDFIDKQLAINLNDAILETSTTCRGIPVRDLLLDCGTDGRIQCGGNSSCTFLNESVYPQLLNITIGPGGRNNAYTYRACVQESLSDVDCYEQDPTLDNQLLDFKNGDCRRLSIISGIFPLPTRSGKVVYSVLKICR